MMVKRVIFIPFLILFLFASFLRADEVVTMQFATDPWPPFFIENKSGDVNSGVGFELVTELFTLIPDVEVVFPNVPWKRALLEVEQGVKDSVALLMKNEERAKYMIFTQPVMQSSSWMYFNRLRFPKGFEWVEVEDFKDLRIGVVRGYTYGEPLDSYIKYAGKNVYEVTTSAQLFSMLQRQHIDLVPENAAVANSIVSTQGWLETLGHAKKIVNTDLLHIGVSKKSKFASLVPRLNEAVELMRISGRIDQIVGVNGSSVKPHQ